MSQPFPLSAFASLADNQPVACIEGRLVKLFGQKTGTSTVGEWAIQNGEIEADGVVVPVMFKDRPALAQNLKDAKIRLTACTEKGMTGLYAMDDQRNGITTRKLRVTASAILDIIGDSPQPQPAPTQQPAAQQPTQPTQPTTPKPAPAATARTADPVVEAKRTIMQIANLHLLCAMVIEKVEAPAFKARTGHEMSESVRQGATASVFIESCRSGLVRNMPTSLIAED